MANVCGVGKRFAVVGENDTAGPTVAARVHLKSWTCVLKRDSFVGTSSHNDVQQRLHPKTWDGSVTKSNDFRK